MQDTTTETAYNSGQVYCVLFEESARVGWPTVYQHDLYVIDNEAIKTNHPRQFVWVLRNHGTHILLPVWLPKDHDADDCRAHCWGECAGSLKWLDAIIKTYDDVRYYTYDHETTGLTQVTAEEARTFLSEAMDRVKQEKSG